MWFEEVSVHFDNDFGCDFFWNLGFLFTARSKTVLKHCGGQVYIVYFFLFPNVVSLF